MAQTKFVFDLENAIVNTNAAQITKLLATATPATWNAAGLDISNSLEFLSRSTLKATDIASFAATIVEKGTIESDVLILAIGAFTQTGNYAAAIKTLGAASEGEVRNDPQLIGKLLDITSRSSLTAAQQAELAKLIVSKTLVDSDSLILAVGSFIHNGNYKAAINALTAASMDEVRNDPQLIGKLLDITSNSDLTAAQQAELAKLIVTKTLVDSGSLILAVGDFIHNVNYTAAMNVLTAASTDEVRGDPQFIGKLLDLTAHSQLTPPQQAELAKLIVTKMLVDSDSVILATGAFIQSDNYTAAMNVLTAASADEVRSDPQLIGELLDITSHSRFTPTQQAEMAKLIVSKTLVDSDSVILAVGSFIHDANYNAAMNVLTAASAAEVRSDPRFIGELLDLTAHSQLTPPQQAELAKLIVSKTLVDSDSVILATGAFIQSGNYTAAMNVLTAASADEVRGDPRFIGELLDLTSHSRLTPVEQAKLAELIVSKTIVDSDSVALAVNDFAHMRNFAAVDRILAVASAAEKSQISHTDLATEGYKSGNDSVNGTSGGDTLYGYDGNDNLYGRAGNDILIGGNGNDRLSGHEGRDTMTGGAGKDTFAFNDKTSVDIVTDYDVNAGDVLAFGRVLFNDSVGTVEAAIEDFVFARTSGNNTIISIDADGAGAGRAVDVAVLQNVRNIDIDSLHAKGQIDIL